MSSFAWEGVSMAPLVKVRSSTAVRVMREKPVSFSRSSPSTSLPLRYSGMTASTGMLEGR